MVRESVKEPDWHFHFKHSVGTHISKLTEISINIDLRGKSCTEIELMDVTGVGRYSDMQPLKLACIFAA
jgi:hypothetical protein